MTSTRILIIGIGCGALRAAVWAADPALPADADPPTNSTVVTSHRLNYDQQERLAVFEENVVVRDRDVTIMAERMKVRFTEDNKVDRIEADGGVVIRREDITAMSDRAEYAIEQGTLKLTGNPRIQRDRDQLTGETITLWRDSRRILCEPNARLVITSEQDLQRDARK